MPDAVNSQEVANVVYVKSDRAQTLLNKKNPILKMYGFSKRSFRAYSFLNLYRSDTSRIMLQILF